MLSLRERTDTLRELTRIANEAAAVVMSGYRRRGGTVVEYKGAIDLVTNYDRASEEIIRREITRSFPGYDLVAEESGGNARADRPVIYADPLDGTTNFSHGHPFFAVSLGLVVGDQPEVGVVVAPALGWTHAAARDCGATRNGAPCQVSGTQMLDRSLLATGFPYDRRTSPRNNFRSFVQVKRRAQGVRRCGAAALDLCLVGDGTYDGFWEYKLRTWDLAAGAMVVLEAGGRVTLYEGARLDVRAGEIVATNGAIHDELLAAIAEAETLPPL